MQINTHTCNCQSIVLLFISIAIVITVIFLAPIPQDPAYHNFADKRALFGITNFWNVLSNLPFMLIGMLGLTRYFQKNISAPSTAYILFCTGAFFVAFGSSYYHFNPEPLTLVWDRLPMTIAFMAFFSMVLQDRVSEKLGKRILWPLVFAGFSSVGYWYWTELQGAGDLRAYALVQFLPMILIPLILLLYPGKRLKTVWLWMTILAYSLAKITEHLDLVLYNHLTYISGHSIKHLLGSLSILCVIFASKKVQ
jgi:hypothetical protein